jgi:hypothetical protein
MRCAFHARKKSKKTATTVKQSSAGENIMCVMCNHKHSIWRLWMKRKAMRRCLREEGETKGLKEVDRPEQQVRSLERCLGVCSGIENWKVSFAGILCG